MGGPSGSTIQTQQQLTQGQMQIAQQQNALQQQNYARMNQLEQPAINFYSGIAGGDAAQTNLAIQPMMSNITQGYASAKQQILNNTPPGAARDMAIAQLETQKDTATGSFLNQTVLGAYDKLANMGAGFGSFSLQELGASLQGYQGASGSNQILGQQQAAASPWNSISSLIGDAMGMLSIKV